MKNIFLGLILSSLFLSSTAQDKRTLLTINKETVTVDEFLAIYNKNNTSNVIDKKTIEEYVDLFINFKLKVIEAENLGMDTISKFINELAGYRRQLAQPYLVDKAMNDQLVDEAYARMTEDIAAYHVLIKVADNASPIDTLKAIKKLQALTKGVNTESDMQRLIKSLKMDNDDNTIAEDLGYFTAFSMVYPFETVAYKTEVNTLSKPVRTRFGYHVIFVKDKRKARGEIRVSHIMTKSNSEMDGDAQLMSKKKIDEIYQQLSQGADFKTLAKQYSEDQGTADKGGVLPWFGTGRMVESFEEAAFSLSMNGEYTQPIQTPYGWHIIRREDYKDIGTKDELKATIKKKIERDSRGQKGRESLIAKLKTDYSITYNAKNRASVEKIVNNDFLSGKWNPQTEITSNDPVLTINDSKYSNRTVKYSQSDYFKFLKQNQPRNTDEKLLSTELESKWKEFEESKLVDFEDGNLESKYPEFKALMQEYHDGILLFDLMDQKVWSKAVKDSAGLNAYYDSNKNDFMWGERVDASVYVCANETVAASTKKMLNKAAKKGYTDTDILSEINELNALNLSIESKRYSRGDNASVDLAPWEKGTHDVSREDDKIRFVVIKEVLEPEPKKLNESRGLVTSAYQSELEADWIKELRGKYSFNIDKGVFNTIQ